MTTTAIELLNESRAALGDASMGDRELGERLGGYSQQFISSAKRGKMTDPLAMRIAQVTGRDAGEVLLIARAERERDPAIREALLAYAGKVLRLVPSNAAKAGMVMAVACGAAGFTSPTEARAGSHLQESVYYVN